MSDITISHNPAEGTLVTGTARGDGAAELLKARRFRWSRHLGCWYLPQSRDRIAGPMPIIEGAREALRDAGFTVTVVTGTERRSVAEREQERSERAEARAARHEQYAVNAAGRAEQRFDTAHRMGQAIPFGQPVLLGHHSQTRDQNYRARIGKHLDRGVEESRKADYHQGRAEAAEVGQRYRHNPRVIMRRLDSLRAEQRRVVRELAKWPRWEGPERLYARSNDLCEQIAYWETRLDEEKERGFRQYGPEDVSAGDWVKIRQGWHEVRRVNKKSVTVPHIIDRLADAGHTWRVPWDEIRDVHPGGE